MALLALYHDVTEILTGDMPTPIKYKNETLKKAYKEVEAQAGERLCQMLPDDLKDEYLNILSPDGQDKEFLPLVKASLHTLPAILTAKPKTLPMNSVQTYYV